MPETLIPQTAQRTVWVRQEGEMPGAPIYANETIGRRLTAEDYADAMDLYGDDAADLRWETAGAQVELWDGDEPTGWSLAPATVIEEV